MPVSPLQGVILRLLASNRSDDSYVAGSTPLQLLPNSRRISSDVDLFQDSLERVATAFAADEQTLRAAGYNVTVRINQRSFIRAAVRRGSEMTLVDWAHDSAWRFMPTVRSDLTGYELHAVDVAVNKVMALAGREEARDFLDVLDIDRTTLPLVALCWAGPGKDPGFSPRSLLEMLKRRGHYRPEQFEELRITQPLDLVALKSQWLGALERAERELEVPPMAERGCLYYSPSAQRFVWPVPERGDAVPHYGRPGGILPAVVTLTSP